MATRRKKKSAPTIAKDDAFRAHTRGESAPMRSLTILAQDPSIRLNNRVLTSQVEISAEPLIEGPCGARIKVVDFDASADRLYLPMIDGYQKDGEWLDPFRGEKIDEHLGNPHFHQQNVYAVAMHTLARFESALGRRVNFAFSGHQLHIAPHAFSEANAYYQRESRSLCFGYFPGPHNRTIFTCLSHDVVAHEMTHALLDGLRPRYIDPSSADQAGIHEGYSDIVALLSVLGETGIVGAILAKRQVVEGKRPLVKPSDLTLEALQDSTLLGLADQMGPTLPNGSISALRRSIKVKPNKRWIGEEEYQEPHRRGEVLVSAVMNAFVKVWLARIEDLTPVEQGKFDGTRVIEEGVTAARHLLTMCIRALDYAPPTDLQFSDYLSALLTADKETVPDDSRYHYRDVIRACFGAWGIEPTSQKNTDGCWEAFSEPVSYRNIRFESLVRDKDEAFRFIWENFQTLKLAKEAYTEVQAVHPIARVAPDGLIVRETVIDFQQMLTVRGHELSSLGLKRPPEVPTSKSVRLYGGGALVFDEFGRLKYSIGNNVANVKLQQERLDYLAKVGFFEYQSEAAFSRGFFARLHLARSRDRWTP